MHGTEALEAFFSSGGSRSLLHGPPDSVRARVPRKDFGTPFLLYGRPLENRTTCSASGVVGSGVFARFRHKWLFFFFSPFVSFFSLRPFFFSGTDKGLARGVRTVMRRALLSAGGQSRRPDLSLVNEPCVRSARGYATGRRSSLMNWWTVENARTGSSVPARHAGSNLAPGEEIASMCTRSVPSFCTLPDVGRV